MECVYFLFLIFSTVLRGHLSTLNKDFLRKTQRIQLGKGKHNLISG